MNIINYVYDILTVILTVFRQQILCDVSVRIGERIFAVHKVVLSANSEFFDKMFTGWFKESRVNEIVLNDIDPNAFESILDSMYMSSIKITEQNVQV